VTTAASLTPPTTPPVRPELAAIKARQQATWASGDYAVIGTTLTLVPELLCEAMDLRAGEAVLDVACGNGTATLAAARRFCRTTGLDYVPSLLARAEERARSERLEISFVEGDAEALPFQDGQFDAVLSTFGVMFTPDHQRTAAELVRVVRPGGRIGLANWTPDGFVGQLLGLVGRTVPPPAGLAPPPLWGTLPYCEALFGDVVMSQVQSRHREFTFRYASAEHFIDVFRRFYGPVHRLYQTLPPERAAAFTADLTALIGRFNRAHDGTVVMPSRYLELVLTRC
jgi:ubiquinone/menaquinone biosynthesis C-methylase UbiE